MHFNVALDLLSTQMTYPSLPEFLELFYEELVGDSRPVVEFVIRSSAVIVIILALYLFKEENRALPGCVIFLAALVFIVPALFVFVIALWLAIVGLYVLLHFG